MKIPRSIFLSALLPALLLTQCASSPQPQQRPSIEDVFRTASHEERVLKLYHAVKALDDVPYVWGGSSPQWGMDCSGFAQYVMREVGLNIPRTVREQVAVGEKVSKRHLMPGDLLFFDSDRGRPGADHVGIYMGRGYFAHSTSPVGVTVEKLDDYEHDVRLAKRVMHERTGAYVDEGPGKVTGTYSSSWDEASIQDETCRHSAAPGHCQTWDWNSMTLEEQLDLIKSRDEKSCPKVKHRDTGSGELIGVRLEDKNVLYTIKLSDGSEHQFYVEKDVHSDSVDMHGDLLGITVEWDETYHWIKGW